MAKKPPDNNIPSGRRGLGKAGRGVADYESASAELLKRAIVAAANTGGALRFGYTSDSGAYAIGIYGDGTPYTEYISPAQDLDITLALVIDLFNSIADDQATVSKGK